MASARDECSYMSREEGALQMTPPSIRLGDTAEGTPEGECQPLVSVVTPSMNALPFLVENVESVRSQDYPAIEHIICDGGSTDGTQEVLRCFPHLRWISERDRGQSDALNKGFRMARGEIVGWLNADDVYELGAVARAVGYLIKHPEIDLVYGDVRVIDAEGRELGISRSESLDIDALLSLNPIPQPSVFLRRRCLELLGGLDESLHYVMDWELWIRFALAGLKAQYLQGEVLAGFRLCAGTKSFEHPMRFRQECVGVLESLFASAISAGIREATKRRSLKKHKAQYYLDHMTQAIARKDRRTMLRYLLTAVRTDFCLVGNRGLWLFLLLGMVGRKIDPLRKYKKRLVRIPDFRLRGQAK